MATKKKAAAKKRGPQCKCVSEVSKKVEDQYPNVTLDMPFTLSGVCYPKIALVKKEPRKGPGRLPLLIPTHCPFCGKKYVE